MVGVRRQRLPDDAFDSNRDGKPDVGTTIDYCKELAPCRPSGRTTSRRRARISSERTRCRPKRRSQGRAAGGLTQPGARTHEARSSLGSLRGDRGDFARVRVRWRKQRTQGAGQSDQRPRFRRTIQSRDPGDRADRDVSESAGPGSVTPNIRRVYALLGEGEERKRVLVCRRWTPT